MPIDKVGGMILFLVLNLFGMLKSSFFNRDYLSYNGNRFETIEK